MTAKELTDAIDKAARKLRNLRDDRDQLGRRKRKRLSERKRRRKRRSKVTEQLREARREYAVNPTPRNAAKVKALEHKRRDLNTKLDTTEEKLEDLRKRLSHIKSRVRWWVARRTWLRKKLKKKQATGDTSWEPWMANGHDANVVQGVKDFCARGVVNFGLYVTSLQRNYVPPGGSSTSYHLSHRAGDIAGARMAQFQHSEFVRNKGNGNCLELFGPLNWEWLKNGGVTGGGEGTPLETLHDSHDHGAFAR